MKQLTAIGLAAGLLAAGTATATDDTRWYLGADINYVNPDNDLSDLANTDIDDGYGLNLVLGKQLGRFVNLELDLFGDALEVENRDNIEQYGAMLNSQFFFSRSAQFAPYFQVGAGWMNTNTDFGTNDDSDDGAVANIGLGFTHDISKHGSKLRGSVLYRISRLEFNNSPERSYQDWVFNLGVIFPLGAKPMAPAPKPVPVPRDNDGDGVLNGADRCPTTPAGVAVGRNGCALDSDRDGVPNSKDVCSNTPKGVKVDRFGCPQDADKDSVPDSFDKCPNTPAGYPVGPNGCALDRDQDGVVDGKDRCPATPAGAKTDIHGCPLPDVIVLRGVNFEYKSATLTTEATRILDATAATLRKNPTVIAEIAGHTDNIGSNSYNKRLSQQRAQSVLNYLVSQGAKAANLQATGYGKDSPIADNSTEEGRAENRRVELRILSK